MRPISAKGANIADRKELIRNIKDHDRFAFHFKEQSFSIGQLTGRSDVHEFYFWFISSSVIEHDFELWVQIIRSI